MANIGSTECIAANDWQMDPELISKSSGDIMEAWFDGSEMIGISSRGWISEDLGTRWPDHFMGSNCDRTKEGEKHLLIFDGHGAARVLCDHRA